MRPRNIKLTPYVRMTYPRQVKWMPPSAYLLRQSPAFLQETMSDLTATILGYRCAWTATHGNHPGICVCLVPKAILSCTCAREVRQIVQLLSFSLSSLSFVFFQPSHLRLTG